jgi:hypothetical protein
MSTNETAQEELWDYTPPVPDNVRQHPLPWDHTPPVPEKPQDWVGKNLVVVIVAVAILVVGGIIAIVASSGPGAPTLFGEVINTSSQDYQAGFGCGQYLATGAQGPQTNSPTSSGSEWTGCSGDDQMQSTAANCFNEDGLLGQNVDTTQWLAGCYVGAGDPITGNNPTN